MKFGRAMAHGGGGRQDGWGEQIRSAHGMPKGAADGSRNYGGFRLADTGNFWLEVTRIDPVEVTFSPSRTRRQDHAHPRDGIL